MVKKSKISRIFFGASVKTENSHHAAKFTQLHKLYPHQQVYTGSTSRDSNKQSEDDPGQ